MRELFGYTPWYFSQAQSPLIPAEDVREFLPMFGQLLEPQGFAGACKLPQYRCPLGCILLKTAAMLWLTGGLTTAERRHVCYNYT